MSASADTGLGEDRLALRDTGLEEIPAVREAMETYAHEPGLLSEIGGEQLLEKVEAGEVVLLDLRPREEFDSGHLPHARSIPYTELSQRMGAPGDFARAYVIAHEVGHHIQNLLGVSNEVHARQRGAGPTAAGTAE